MVNDCIKRDSVTPGVPSKRRIAVIETLRYCPRWNDVTPRHGTTNLRMRLVDWDLLMVRDQQRPALAQRRRERQSLASLQATRFQGRPVLDSRHERLV
jgi:hypothetical protein